MLNTNAHIRTSRPRRMTVRVSSLMVGGSPPPGVEGEGRAAHRDAGAVVQSLAGDAVPVDEGAVRGAQVADAGDEVRAVAGDADLAVAPGDPRVVEHDVGRVVTAQHGDRAEQRVALAVDLQPRPVGGVGPLGRRRLVDGGGLGAAGGACWAGCRGALAVEVRRRKTPVSRSSWVLKCTWIGPPGV